MVGKCCYNKIVMILFFIFLGGGGEEKMKTREDERIVKLEFLSKLPFLGVC
jgi:hypothetical protein